jgi:hypothetical protein
MTKTYKFAEVASDKKAVELTFYSVEEPVTAVEMFDMFHAFCLASGIPEVTYRYQVMNLAQAYQTPPVHDLGATSMGMKAPEPTGEQGSS